MSAVTDDIDDATVDPLDLGDWSSYVAEATAAETGEEPPQQHFGWFGRRIRIRRHIATLTFADFYRGIESGRVTETQMIGALRALIDPDDFTAFCDAADANPIDGEDLLKVIDSILEAKADRPTGQPSESSDGSGSTSPTSTPGSEQKALAPLSTEAKVAARLGIPLPPESRPDLRAALRLVDEPMVPVAETG